jgi:HNH endonuclease
MWDQRARHDRAPLLDELGACIDHVRPYVAGGEHDASNFAAACNRCNQLKGSLDMELFLVRNPCRRKGEESMHGPPRHWDGLSSLFMAFACQHREQLTPGERLWLEAFEAYHRAEEKTE